MARPPLRPTATQRQQVEQLANLGVTTEAIGHAIGEAGAPLDPKTVRRHFRAELDRGAALCTVRVQRKLHELIDSGNPAAIFFYLKCREGWREVQRVETTGPDGAPLPAPVFAAQLYLPRKDELQPLANCAPGSLAEVRLPTKDPEPAPRQAPRSSSREPLPAWHEPAAEPPPRVAGAITRRPYDADPRY